MFTKRETVYLLISISVMSLALGFDDGRELFELGPWLTNLLMVTLMVAFSFVLHQLAHKIVARMQGFDTEYELWGLRSLKPTWRAMMGKAKKGQFPRKIRILGKEYLIRSFPIGVVLSLLVMVVSNGYLFWLAVGQYNLLLKKSSRYGRKFVEITDYEEGKIALAGPMAHVLLLVLAKFFNAWGTFDTFIFINAGLALFYMLPLSRLDGTKIYFGSRLLYVSSLVFIISVIVLAYTVSAIPMLILSGVGAIVGFALYYYYTYYR
jgi:Zn-dependent protease